MFIFDESVVKGVHVKAAQPAVNEGGEHVFLVTGHCIGLCARL